MNIQKKIGVILVFLIIFLSEAKSQNSDGISIIATGETHALIKPCECPSEPRGGLARRFEFVTELKKNNSVLLVDEGGFSAGGIYDLYSRNRHDDSLRTIATLASMGKLNYDAIGIGDDDLQFNAKWLKNLSNKYKLNIVNANCFDKNGIRLFRPYTVVVKNGFRIGITSVTTTENLLDIDTNVVIRDPLLSIKSIWNDLKKDSDIQIIMAHLGENATINLADSIPDCKIFVNGHRKHDVSPILQNGNQYIMQFGFLGKQIAVSNIIFRNRKIKKIDSKWEDINEFYDDSNTVTVIVSKILKSINKNHEFNVTLYIMAECPYGLSAIKEILPVVNSFDNVNFKIGFIGTVNDDGTLKSLHGDNEIKEEMFWLAVKELYPEMWYVFLDLVAVSGLNSSTAIEELELDSVKIASWINNYGLKKLTSEYNRSTRLNINASPTFVMNNRIMESMPSGLRLAKDLCYFSNSNFYICDSLPECVDDYDCSKEGFIGKCINENKKSVCQFIKPQKFRFIVIAPDTSIFVNFDETISTTKELFPGAVIDTVFSGSKLGVKLLNQLNVNALPVYLFDLNVSKTQQFEKIKPGIKRIGDWYTFKDEIFRDIYFYKRPSNNSVILFIDPKFDNGKTFIKSVYGKKNITVLPIIYNTNKKILDSLSLDRRKEARIWVLFNTYYKNKYADYLKLYYNNAEHKSTVEILKLLNIDTDKFYSRFDKEFDKNWNELLKELENLNVFEPVLLFVNNREVVLLHSKSKLDTVLDKILK